MKRKKEIESVKEKHKCYLTLRWDYGEVDKDFKPTMKALEQLFDESTLFHHHFEVTGHKIVTEKCDLIKFK